MYLLICFQLSDWVKTKNEPVLFNSCVLISPFTFQWSDLEVTPSLVFMDYKTVLFLQKETLMYHIRKHRNPIFVDHLLRIEELPIWENTLEKKQPFANKMDHRLQREKLCCIISKETLQRKHIPMNSFCTENKLSWHIWERALEKYHIIGNQVNHLLQGNKI